MSENDTWRERPTLKLCEGILGESVKYVSGDGERSGVSEKWCGVLRRSSPRSTALSLASSKTSLSGCLRIGVDLLLSLNQLAPSKAETGRKGDVVSIP